jgi:hypothetical protein
MRALAAVLILLACPAGPAAAAERFIGTDASVQAGAYIDARLGYASDYTPGTLAVDYVKVYDGAFVTQVRFSPSRGHQVVLGKMLSARADSGAKCAEFRVIVERFTADSLARLERDKSGVRLYVNSMDTIRGTICVLQPLDISVEIAEVRLALPAGHAAFATPYAISSGPGGGGI